MSRLFIWHLLLNCVAQLTFSQANSIYLQQFNRNDGLNAYEIIAMTEDEEGFLWLGTDKGLQRFDGSQFKIFLPNPHDSNSVPSEKIVDLYMDRNHKLWIGTENDGLVSFDLISQRFTVYQRSHQDLSTLAGNKVCAITEDENGLWVLTANNALSFLSYKTGRFKRYLLPQPYKEHTGFFISGINDIIQDMTDPSILWISTVVGLYQFEKNAGAFKTYVADPAKAKWFLENYYHDIWQDDSGLLWCSHFNGLESFDPATRQWAQYPFYKKISPATGFKSTMILPDTGRSLILLTYPFHWLRFDMTTKQYTEYEPSVTNISRWEDLLPSSACKTKDATIWFGSWQSINRVSNRSSPFHTSYFLDEKRGPLQHPNMPLAAMEIGNTGQFLIGVISGDGLIRVNDYKTGQSEIIHNRPSLPDDWLEGAVEDIEPIDSTRWWLGIRGGLFQYKLGDSLFHPYVDAATGKLVFSKNIRSLFVDTDKTLWIGTFSEGLYHLDPSTNSLKRYQYDPRKSESPGSNETICDIIRGPDGKLWIASLSGISILNETNAAFFHFDESVPGMPKTSELVVIDIDSDVAGNVWAATGHGILKISTTDSNRFSVKSYSINQGLESSITHELLIDRNNNIWITTGNSLSFFNTQTESFINFGQRDGISHVSGSDLLEQLSNGIILYGMWGSLLWFHPDSVTRSVGLPKPYLLKFEVSNKEYSGENINATSHIDLSSSEKDISLQMAALELSGNFRQYFAYRLLGYDENWVYPGTRSYVNYTNLPVGSYLFQFKVANSLGQWNPQVKELRIVIQPAFWQRLWFWIACGLLLVVVSWWLVRRRIISIRREAEWKQKIAETEMTALRAQMNPHFIFNCLSAIDNLIQTNQPDKATTYLARFARLIRSVLDSSKNNTVPFQKDFENLQLYLQMEQFRCNNKFRYELNVDENLMHADYNVPPMIAHPFIENAIHHGLLNKPGPDRALEISISGNNDSINYTIIDNGVGREKAAELKMINKPEHISYGIRISAERIHLYNQNGAKDDITITDLKENGLATGTKVELKLKIHDTQ